MKYAKWKNCQSRSRTRSTTFGQRRTDNQMKGHKRICKLDQMSSFHLSLLPFYYVIQELSENWSANYILSWPWCILCNFCNHVLGMRLMFSDSVLPPSNELFDILFIHGSMTIFVWSMHLLGYLVPISSCSHSLVLLQKLPLLSKNFITVF